MFQELLERIPAHLDGVQACILLDRDSVPIAELYPSGRSEAIAGFAIEVTNLVNSLAKRDALEGVGDVREFSLVTSKFATIGQAVSDCLLILALPPDANVDRGRSMIRIIGPWLAKQL